jgi:hypothetical protein
MKNRATILAWLQAVGVILLALTLAERDQRPPIVLLDADAGVADLTRANREAHLDALWRAALLQASRIATASWPHDYHTADERRDEQPSAEAIALLRPQARVQAMSYRQQFGAHYADGRPHLSFGGEPALARRAGGSVYLEAVVHQNLPPRVGEPSVRVFLVKAVGAPAPVSTENPYQLVFDHLHLQELRPKRTR